MSLQWQTGPAVGCRAEGEQYTRWSFFQWVFVDKGVKPDFADLKNVIKKNSHQ